MQPPRQHSRINLTELKAQIVKKLGPDGSKQYFNYLTRFLSLKLNKVEFNKLCLRILGRDNIPLHNQLIRSILKNVCNAKSPPSKHNKDISANNNNNKYLPHGSHATTAQPSSDPPGLPNGGDMLLPPSPKKARTGLRDRRGGDRRSTLRLVNRKTGLAPQPSENSELKLEIENSLTLRRCLDFSTPSFGEDETKDSSLPRSPIRAPLGVTFCPTSGGAHRAPSFIGSIFNDGILSDSVSLKERMEQIALTQGIEGVLLDSADLLNHGLDSYMKRLIRSCVELVGSRHSNNNSNSSISISSSNTNTNTNTNTNNNNMKKHHLKLVNGIKPGYENLGGQLKSNNCLISLEDFRMAMEINPIKLGEDWPLLLEKMCTNSFQE